MRNVDVIIPIHGKGFFLSSTLQSIVAQDYVGLIRVICVLDRVQENVIIELKNWSNRLDLLITHSEGTGISNALNTGIRLSDATYIVRIDDDDVMSSDRISKQIEKMECSGGNLAILGSNILKIDEAGNVFTRFRFPYQSHKVLSMTNYGNPFAHSAVCIRSEVIKNQFEYRSFYEPAEDFDLWTRILEVWEGANLHEYLTSYRVHSRQVSTTNLYRQLVAREAVIASRNLRCFGKQELHFRYKSFDDWFSDLIEGPSFTTRIKVKIEFFLRSRIGSPFMLRALLAATIFFVDYKQFYARMRVFFGACK